MLRLRYIFARFVVVVNVVLVAVVFFVLVLVWPKALEEEVEVLTATLQQTEAANDEINLELQELQEQLLAR